MENEIRYISGDTLNEVEEVLVAQNENTYNNIVFINATDFKGYAHSYSNMVVSNIRVTPIYRLDRCFNGDVSEVVSNLIIDCALQGYTLDRCILVYDRYEDATSSLMVKFIEDENRFEVYGIVDTSVQDTITYIVNSYVETSITFRSVMSYKDSIV